MTAWFWDLTYTVSVRCGNPPPGAKKESLRMVHREVLLLGHTKSKIIPIWRNMATT